MVVGSGRIPGEKGTDVVRLALERGVNYFDTSPDYSAAGSEEAIGQAIRGVRDKLFVATKFCTPAGTSAPGTPGRRSTWTLVEASLAPPRHRLRRPRATSTRCDEVERLMDPNMHEAFDRLKQEGKVRFLGFSSHTPNLVRGGRDAAIASGRFDVMMLAYHHGIWPQLAELIERARREQDMGVVAMKTLKGAKHHGLAGFREHADAYSQAALKWVLSNPERLVRGDLVLRAPARGRVPARLGRAARARRRRDPREVRPADRRHATARPHCGACLDELPRAARRSTTCSATACTSRTTATRRRRCASTARSRRTPRCAPRAARPAPAPVRSASRSRSAWSAPTSCSSSDERGDPHCARGRCFRAHRSLVVLASRAPLRLRRRGRRGALPARRAPGRCPSGACSPHGGAWRAAARGCDAGALPDRRHLRDRPARPCSRTTCPTFLWTDRDRFFYEGMRLEIGPCFADYAPARRSSRTPPSKAAGKATLDAERRARELRRPGCPSARATSRPDDPQAGLSWLWNVQQPLPGRGLPRPLPHDRPRRQDRPRRALRGRDLQAHHLAPRRPRRPATRRRARAATCGWRAGSSTEPFDAREYAWRQYRNVEEMLTEAQPLRRPARLPAAVAARPAHERRRDRGASTCPRSRGRGAEPGAPARRRRGARAAIGGVRRRARDGGTIQTKRSGYEGLEFRPAALRRRRWSASTTCWRRSTRATPGWPAAPDRDFGPWGLSFASDRWDLRRALVIEARSKRGHGRRDRERASGALRRPPDAAAALHRHLRHARTR